MILAGDIGGTNTRLATFSSSAGGVRRGEERTYPSRRYASLDAIVAEFLAEHRVAVGQACFGVAGPVRDGRCATTNLAWIVDEATLRSALASQAVWLINDLEANAYGVAALTAGEIVELQAGAARPTGNAAIIAAGTGLGEAGMYWDGARHHPFASEGGHADFAPRDGLEVELLRFLAAELGRVSWERVVSGPGLHNIFRFLRDTGRGEEEPWLAEALAAGDASAAIARAALDRRSPLAARALEMFVSLYGAEAGNLALKTMATGGVYLGGGIAPKILPALRGGGFLRAFNDKGRMSELMAAMPVRVIDNEATALLGAARCAALRAGLIEG